MSIHGGGEEDLYEYFMAQRLLLLNKDKVPTFVDQIKEAGLSSIVILRKRTGLLNSSL